MPGGGSRRSMKQHIADMEAHFRSYEELKSTSPTLADGVSEAREGIHRREQYRTVLNGARRLDLPARVPGTAMVFMHKYFARNSMTRNDPLIVSMACLLVASKSEDVPKRVGDVVRECWRARYLDRQDAAGRLELSRPDDKVWLAKTEEQVRMAERALLYQLGFVFHAALPYTPLDTMIEHARRYSEQVFPNRKEVVQTAWNFLNDSWRTNLCLQYDHNSLAAAAMWLAFKVLRIEPNYEGGEPWFTRLLGVDPAAVKDITLQMLQLYEDVFRDMSAKASAASQAALDPKAEPKTETAAEANVQSGAPAGGVAQPAGPWQLQPLVTPQVRAV